jgi:hypothetical protein
MLLDQLEWHKARHKLQSRYQLWQEGYHPQQIQSDEMMLQKLEYIHNNPVCRGYVEDAAHWRYSSVSNYSGKPGLIEEATEW